MTLYEDATHQLATQVAEGTLKTLERREIENLVVDMSKSLQRGADGTYCFAKPPKKKNKTQCPHCHDIFVHLERHINKCHTKKEN